MTEQRTAIVTGGARGIGAAISKRLASDGYAVAVIDLREEDTATTADAIVAAGGRAIGIGADVADAAAVASAVARTAAELGAPTILVNNAGILRDNMLFKTLAIELGPFGVTANAIAPGFIATDMLRTTAERMGITFDQLLEGAAKEIPVRRVGQPEDVATMASFFCSEGAGFVSGQVVYVAGGPKA